MVKITEITLNRQVCFIIDLAILRLDRDQRHAKLDKFLIEYFLGQKLNAKIVHQPGKKADLLLKNHYKTRRLGRACDTQHLNSLNSVGGHSSTQPIILNNDQWQVYNLHISYSLPLVAVTWALKNTNSLGIDLAQEAEFVMENDDWQNVQRLYFSPKLPLFLTTATRCQAWSMLEAQHKCCEIALQEYSPQREALFSHLNVESQCFNFKGQNFWLSVATK